MNKFILSFILSLTVISSAFAEYATDGVNLDYDSVNQTIEDQIGHENTCLDEYLTREQDLKKFLIWAPPVTVVGAPTAFIAGGFTAAAISAHMGVSGWSAIGNALLGAFGSGFAVVGTFITMETVKGVQFAKTRLMTNVIVAANANRVGSKAIYKFTRKYNSIYPEDSMTSEELTRIITELDHDEMLCNGEISGKPNARKLKHKLVSRTELINYIHQRL